MNELLLYCWENIFINNTIFRLKPFLHSFSKLEDWLLLTNSPFSMKDNRLDNLLFHLYCRRLRNQLAPKFPYLQRQDKKIMYVISHFILTIQSTEMVYFPFIKKRKRYFME